MVAVGDWKLGLALSLFVSLMMVIVFLALSNMTHLPMISSAKATDARQPIATVLKISILPNHFIRFSPFLFENKKKKGLSSKHPSVCFE